MCFAFCATGLVFLLGCSSGARSAATEIPLPSAGPTKTAPSGYQGLGSDSIGTETVRQFAAKPLPADLSRKVQGFLDVRSPGLGMLNGKKKQVFFSWRVTGVNQVWRLDSPKSFPVQMTGGEDPTFLADMTPDGQWLVLGRDRAGEENPGLYLQSTAGGPLRLIQHLPKVQTAFQYVSQDSRFVYYHANDREPDSYAIYRFEISSGKKELLFSEKGIWSIGDVLVDKKFLLVKATGSLSREYYQWDLQTKELLPLLGQGEKEQYNVRFAEKEGDFFVLTNKLSDFAKIYRWNLQNKKLVPLRELQVKGEIEGMSIDTGRTRMVISYSHLGYNRVAGLDLKSLSTISFPDFPEADQVYPGSISKEGNHLMIGVDVHNRPRVSYSYNFKTKLMTQWVVPSQPEVETSAFVRARLETFPARDGTQIPMFVRAADKCKKGKALCPIIVHFHGGPEGQSTPGFSLFAQSFVDEGFVYIEPNVRGSDGYGKIWLALDDGAKRLNVITDIEDAAIFLKKEYSIKGEFPKIGVMGGSYGGYSTLMAMTRFAGAYDAGVSNVGMSNLVTFLQNTAPYRRILRTSEYGDLEKDREALVKLSPITYIDQLKAPLLIIQGVSDPRVPVGEALQMFESLKKKGIQSDLILFADEGHGSQKRGNQVLEWGHELQFFNKHLKSTK